MHFNASDGWLAAKRFKGNAIFSGDPPEVLLSIVREKQVRSVASLAQPAVGFPGYSLEGREKDLADLCEDGFAFSGEFHGNGMNSTPIVLSG
jgi:hypothetical protein